MAWRSRNRYLAIRDADKPFTLEGLRVNDQCFIRKEHRCGKIVGASKSCFIACPTNDELEPILGLLSEKLTKVGIEPIIAVKERAYGQDIFCTKICGKIVESKFCIVILDDTMKKTQNIPNPNVYYEYGLMTTMRKHIIPLQKENQKLAFNIQSYDTIKYSSKNIASELERAIRDAIGLTESKDKHSDVQPTSDRSILRALELAGLEPREDNWVLSDALGDTGFKGFGQYDNGFYAFVGKVDQEQDIDAYLDDLDIVTYRSENKVKELEAQIREHKKEVKNIKDLETKRAADGMRQSSMVITREKYEVSKLEEKIKAIQEKLALMKTIYIGFILGNQVDIAGFEEKALSIVKDRKRFKVVLSENCELTLGGTKVSFARSK